MEEKDDYITSNVDSESSENKDEDVKEEIKGNPSFQQLQRRTTAVTK
jgi:hypothetical protein